jgi:hypothetical protein
VLSAHDLQRGEREKATCAHRTSGFLYVPRERLVERLNAELLRQGGRFVHKLTLVSINPRHPATCPEPFDKLRTGSAEGLSKESAVLAKQPSTKVMQVAEGAVSRKRG